MGRATQWWRPVVAVSGSLAVLVAGAFLRTGPADQTSAADRTAAAGGGVTNLTLVPGTSPDDPGFSGGTRTLSATPMLWVNGASLRLDVRREGRTIRVRQGRTDLAVRPHSVLQGLPGFLTWKLLDARGTVVASRSVDVCPMPGTLFTTDAWGFSSPALLDPANPATPQTWPFPAACGDPLTSRAQWGFASGWAAPFHIAVPDDVPPGSYTLDARINADGAVHERTLADDHVRMAVEVLDLTGGLAAARPATARVDARALRHPGSEVVTRAGVPVRSPAARGSDGREDLPDLVPLPSENIATRADGPVDSLRFNATVVNAGRGPLQVEGFRTGPDTMRAEQVLFDGDRPRVRRAAGTISLDADEEEWHFDALARYRLLDRHGAVVATSGKIGFCFGNVHQVDSTNPGFTPTPQETGFAQCFGSLLQSVRERLDPGWGDEYDQVVPEQELDITSVPNGTYRIQILADPEHRLTESRRDNNASVRTVVLSGSPGARTVTVPPVDGVDTEAAWASVTLPF